MTSSDEVEPADENASAEPHIAPPEDVPAVSAEELVDGEAVVVEGADELEERKYPSTIGGAFYLLILAVVAVGMVLVVLGHWRNGIRIFAGSLMFAAVIRVVLKPRDAGMLAVRNKPFDVGILVVLGAAMFALASSIPEQ